MFLTNRIDWVTTMKYNRALITHKLLRWENYLGQYRLPAWSEIPNIGLYMDQVIALLSDYLDFLSADQPLTAATINNYVRLRVMPAPLKRRYHRVHIAYLLVIFTLKHSCSISGVRRLIPYDLEEDDLIVFYEAYRDKLRDVGEFFTQQTRVAAQDLLSSEEDDDGLVSGFIIQSLLMSGFSQILAERLLHLQEADFDEVVQNERVHRSQEPTE